MNHLPCRALSVDRRFLATGSVRTNTGMGIVLFGLLGVVATNNAWCQSNKPPASGAEPPAVAAATDLPPFDETSSVRQNTVVIGGQRIAYHATVGDLLMRDDEGKVKSRFTYVSYVRDGVTDAAKRPVTFAFNGGPGSASVWVHLGAFGPKKATLNDEGFPQGPPPGALVDNPDSVLDITDLVFVDPVPTGFSRPAPDQKVDQFLGFSNDIETVGEFIRLWISREGRWLSPKFVAGESYGTTRAAGLALHLQDRYGLYLNGVCLISSVLNWQTKVFNVGNDLPHILHLPTFAATAWYHGKLGERYRGDLAGLRRDVEQFALGEYATALMKGDALSEQERRQVVDRLVSFTGLSPEYIEQVDLRLEIFRFTKELLRDQKLTVGRLDSRYTGIDRDGGGESFEYDPASAVTEGWYVSLINDYLRRELGYPRDIVFRQSAQVFPWNYHETGRVQGYNTNGYANYAEHLRAAMHQNPYLQVLVMSGYYDLATPYFATDYTVTHMQLAPEVRDNIQVAYYQAGHMMYVRKDDLEKFRRDYMAFVERALAATR